MSRGAPTVWPRAVRVAWTLALAGLGLVLAARIVEAPVDRYGDSAAGWIEHQARLRALAAAAEAAGPLDLLRRADGLYPPGLHLLSAPLFWMFGPDPRAAGLVGPLALGVMAWGVGRWAEACRAGAGLPAAALTALTPALHGMAARYAYDLPMASAVWAAIGWTAGSRRAPAQAAMATGVASLVKWSALPLGLPLLLATLRRRQPAAGMAAVAAVLLAPPCGAAMGLASLQAMTTTTFQPPTGSTIDAALFSLPMVGPTLGAMWAQASAIDATRLAFYPSRLWWSCFGPLGAVGLLPLVARGLAHRSARHSAMWATVLTGVFLLLVLPPLDERFLVVWLGLPAAIGAIGLCDLGPRTRVAAGVLSAGIGLGLALDLHAPGRWAPTLDPSALSAAAQGRGPGASFGAASAVDRRGWARTTDRLPSRDPLGNALLSALHAAGAGKGRPVLVRDRLRLPEGEQNWWGAVTAAAALQGRPLDITVLQEGPVPAARSGSLLLLPAQDAPWAEADDAQPPAAYRPCAVPFIADPEGGPGLRCFQHL